MKTQLSNDHAVAAYRILTPEAAERYCLGDMTATDEHGHAAIEGEVKAIIEQRLAETQRKRAEAISNARAIALVPEMVAALEAVAGNPETPWRIASQCRQVLAKLNA